MTMIQAIENCQQDKKIISQSISQVQFEELSVLKIDHPTSKAAITLQGAHLLYWQPASEKSPVIWLSDKALFKKATPIRGGIPICWPWFGKSGDPMHGFARIVDWQLQSHSENAQGVDLVLTLKSNPQTAQYWSKSFELAFHIHLGTSCKVELSCKGDFEATSALHTYFGISDIAAITLTGLGDSYQERLSTVNESKVIGEMTFNQEVDRIYTNAESTMLIKDSNRTIKITHINQSDIVAWNPWIDKAKATADLADESYHNFVCVETCRINKPIKSTSKEKTTYGVNVEVIK